MRTKKAVKPMGLGVYQDGKERYVYYDRLNRKAYQILKSDYRKFNVLSTRFLTSLAVGYLVFAICNILWVGIVSGFIVYISMLVYFRKLFIKGSTYVDGFKPDKGETYISKTAKRVSTLKCVTLIILLIALAVLSIINIYSQNYELSVLILNYILTIGSFIVAVLYILVLIYKLKNK